MLNKTKPPQHPALGAITSREKQETNVTPLTAQTVLGSKGCMRLPTERFRNTVTANGKRQILQSD